MERGRPNIYLLFRYLDGSFRAHYVLLKYCYIVHNRFRYGRPLYHVRRPPGERRFSTSATKACTTVPPELTNTSSVQMVGGSFHDIAGDYHHHVHHSQSGFP